MCHSLIVATLEQPLIKYVLYINTHALSHSVLVDTSMGYSQTRHWMSMATGGGPTKDSCLDFSHCEIGTMHPDSQKQKATATWREIGCLCVEIVYIGWGSESQYHRPWTQPHRDKIKRSKMAWFWQSLFMLVTPLTERQQEMEKWGKIRNIILHVLETFT